MILNHTWSSLTYPNEDPGPFCPWSPQAYMPKILRSKQTLFRIWL